MVVNTPYPVPFSLDSAVPDVIHYMIKSRRLLMLDNGLDLSWPDNEIWSQETQNRFDLKAMKGKLDIAIYRDI